MSVEELPKQFIGGGDVKGFKFTQIANGERAYIYEVECEESYTKDKSTHYEVIEKVAVEKCLDFANRIYSDTDLKHRYPKTNEFGKESWCYQNKTLAQNKFNELNSNAICR